MPDQCSFLNKTRNYKCLLSISRKSYNEVTNHQPGLQIVAGILLLFELEQVMSSKYILFETTDTNVMVVLRFCLVGFSPESTNI